MKRIFCIRHAKSSWDNPSLDDFDRPLSLRGFRDAPLMATDLKKHVADIELMVISGAKRTMQTAREFEKLFNCRKIIVNKELYHAWMDDILKIIRQLDDEYSSVMLFGHNPGYTYLYNQFSTRQIDNLPTCGIFELSSDAVAWDGVNRSNTRSVYLRYPKLVSDA